MRIPIEPIDYLLGEIKPCSTIGFFGAVGVGKTTLLAQIALALSQVGEAVSFSNLQEGKLVRDDDLYKRLERHQRGLGAVFIGKTKSDLIDLVRNACDPDARQVLADCCEGLGYITPIRRPVLSPDDASVFLVDNYALSDGDFPQRQLLQVLYGEKPLIVSSKASKEGRVSEIAHELDILVYMQRIETEITFTVRKNRYGSNKSCVSELTSKGFDAWCPLKSVKAE